MLKWEKRLLTGNQITGMKYMDKQYRVKKLDKPVDWMVEVPGSKSMTNRALLMAALSDGEVKLDGVLFSDDSRHFLESLVSLGFTVDINEQEKKVTVLGCGGDIPKKQAVINVGSAGTAARFLTAMLGFSDGEYTIEASEQMKKRPMEELFSLLMGVGAKITYLEKEGHLPVQICGRRNQKADRDHVTAENEDIVLQNHDTDQSQADTKQDAYNDQLQAEQKPLRLDLDISKSTQFLSALLLISPMVQQGLDIHITSEKTDGSYIRITRKMLADAGVEVKYDGKNYCVEPKAIYQKNHYQIEPDLSAACYFYAAAAITGGRALVKHVHPDNSQGDMKFLDVLTQMGCTVTEKTDGIEVTGPAEGQLKGIDIDMNDFSDQALTLAAIAPFCNSDVHITHIGHIRGQECDRLHAMSEELTKRGIICTEEPDAITIKPGTPAPGIISTYEDHRVAMSFALLGLKVDGIVIDNPSCCRKTFENYFELLDMLSGKNR